MKVFKGLIVALFTTLLMGCATSKKEIYEQYVAFPKGASLEEKVKIAANLVPSPQQLAWQSYELTAFIHFGINTFTDREWGTGEEDPALFNPTNLDTEQWVRTLHEAGFKMVILTAKHHDGFCLWPTETTDYSVASSPWRDGKGDLVQELADACAKYDMRLGLYLSPWDRNHPTYGTGDGYNQVYLQQLRELLTNYGEVDEVWFDGANGEGPNGKRQEYDWDAVIALIKELQPNAVTAIVGKDVRWVGNERGYGRETEWSATVLPPESSSLYEEVQKSLDISRTSVDLGSREMLAKADHLFWYPSEVDVSIRPGWFYHEHEDDQVKSLAQLAEIYFSSVGMNSSLLLNIPPNREGLLSDADVERILEFGAFVRAYNSRDAVQGHSSVLLNEGDSYEVLLDHSIPFSSVLLQEDISKGQRVEAFTVEVEQDGTWYTLVEGTTIGYKRILLTEVPLKGSRLRFTPTKSRGEVHLARIAAHLVPTIADAEVLAELPKIERSSIKTVVEAPLTVELPQERADVTVLIYTPQATDGDRLPTHYKLYQSSNGTDWNLLQEGEFSNIVNNPIPQVVTLPTKGLAPYVRFVGTNQAGQEVEIGVGEIEWIVGEV